MTTYDSDLYDDDIDESLAPLLRPRSRTLHDLQERYAFIRDSVLENIHLMFGFADLHAGFEFPDMRHREERNNAQQKLSVFAHHVQRKELDGVDTTRRRRDMRMPFPIQQFHPQQETRWTIPHEIGVT